MTTRETFSNLGLNGSGRKKVRFSTELIFPVILNIGLGLCKR